MRESGVGLPHARAAVSSSSGWFLQEAMFSPFGGVAVARGVGGRFVGESGAGLSHEGPARGGFLQKAGLARVPAEAAARWAGARYWRERGSSSSHARPAARSSRDRFSRQVRFV
ncbi:hypothetical protein Hesp01_02310 [Herbidospora sp. NBRC 101105]|nr:hypothetical protein Hesp01_02310 [Herbidospora sp. NBRC 101105]